jgi:hypothetical protein
MYLIGPWRWVASIRRADTSAGHRSDAMTAQIDARLRHAREVRSDPARWDARVRQAVAAYPPTADVPGALGVLRSVAAGASVQIVSLSASPPVLTPGRLTPTPIQIEIKVIGAVPGVEAFLSSLRSSRRLFTTSAASFTADTSSQSQLTAQVTGQLWLMASGVGA